MGKIFLTLTAMMLSVFTLCAIPNSKEQIELDNLMESYTASNDSVIQRMDVITAKMEAVYTQMKSDSEKNWFGFDIDLSNMWVAFWGLVIGIVALGVGIVGTWYGYPDVPVGIIRDGADCGADSTSYTRKVLDMKDGNGSPLFARSHAGYGDYPESVGLYRKVLSEAEDGSVTVVSVGFSTNLARLLESEADEFSPLSGRELAARKVKMLYTMAGNIADTTHHEYNVVIDIPSAQKVFAEWPTPVITSPFELGAQIKYPASSIENDFGWAGPHPAVEAYKAYMQMPYDRETWDLTAVLAAVEGGPEYFTVSPQGTITVTDSGATVFEEGDGNRAYLSVTPEQAENIKARIVSLITSEPAGYRR